MGNLPVIQELGTGFQALGDHVTGNPEKGRERWDNYYNESVFGSAWAGATERSKGNEDKAQQYFRGFGRATGKAIFGGGLLKDVPLFHELAVCGESLGDVLGGRDTASARRRWNTYVEGSLIGGGLGTVRATVAGDRKRAEKLGQGFVKAGLRFGVAGVSVAAALATAGTAALYGATYSATGAVVGVLTGAASTAATQVIDEGEVHDPSAVVGNSLFGAALLWANGNAPGLCANNAAGVFPRSVRQDTEALKEIPTYGDAATILQENFVQVDGHGPRDVVIILEGSASIESSDFEVAKTALQHLVRLRGKDEIDTKYAAITFSDTAAWLSFPFLSCDEASKEIGKIPYPDSLINTQTASTEAKKLFDDSSSGGRNKATKVVFMVINGHSDIKHHVTKATALKGLGVQIFLVVVGTEIGDIDDKLRVVSYPPEKFFLPVENFLGLLQIIQRVVSRVCPGGYIPEAVRNIPPPEVTLQQINIIVNIAGVPDETCPAPQQKDIVVIMDGSGSIPSGQFDDGKQALKHMMEIETERGTDTKFAALTYSDRATLNFSFLPHEEAAKEIGKIRHPSGQTNTQAALAEARKLFEDHGLSSGKRADAKKMIYLVTDGQSNVERHRTLPEAEALKTIGVEIVVVAVGSFTQGIDEMVKLASYPPETFLCRVENHHGFLEIVKLALKQVAPARYALEEGQKSD